MTMKRIRRPVRPSFLAAGLALIALSAFLTSPAYPATLLVTSPGLGICVTSQDAVYDYHWGSLSPHQGLFSYFPVGQGPLTPNVHAPQEAGPGDLMRIEITENEDIDSLSAQLLDAKQRVLARGVGFRPEDARKDRWVVLLGVASEVQHGDYSISVTAQAGARSALFLGGLSIRERAFKFERIPLNESLTALRSEKDPRKEAEAREMYRILTTAHPDAIYEQGTMINPLPSARRTSGYGDRRKYVYTDNNAGYSVHEGLDLAVPQGTPVPASGKGRVVFAGMRIMTGNSIVIEHLPGLFSIYLHLSEIDVKEGDVVAAGQIIGKVGMTGLATGPHLHWQIDSLGISVDPDEIAAGPILDRNTDFSDIEKARVPKGGE